MVDSRSVTQELHRELGDHFTFFVVRRSYLRAAIITGSILIIAFGFSSYVAGARGAASFFSDRGVADHLESIEYGAAKAEELIRTADSFGVTVDNGAIACNQLVVENGSGLESRRLVLGAHSPAPALWPVAAGAVSRTGQVRRVVGRSSTVELKGEVFHVTIGGNSSAPTIAAISPAANAHTYSITECDCCSFRVNLEDTRGNTAPAEFRFIAFQPISTQRD